MQTDTAKQLAQEIFDKVDGVPGLTEVTQRVINLLENEDSTLEDIEMAIRADQTLATQVLRYANARYFKHEKQVGSLQQAIQLLGFNTLRSIALLQGMDRQYTTPELPTFPRQEFWKYSLATGTCAEVIASRLGYDSDQKGDVFSAGHIHAVGKTILDQYMHEDFEKIMDVTRRQDIPMIEAEEDVLGMTHCEIGAEVFNQWNLPDELVETARHYYHPPDDAPDTVRIVHLASVLTKTKGYGHSGDDVISYLNEDCVERLGLSNDELEEILQGEFPRRYKRLRDLFEG